MGIPLSLAMGVSSVTTADPPLNREELAFPTPYMGLQVCPFDVSFEVLHCR